MLVLSRHRLEKIVIGDDITISVIDIRGDKVRLGIDAPAHVPIHRQEIYDAIRRDAPEGSAGKSSLTNHLRERNEMLSTISRLLGVAPDLIAIAARRHRNHMLALMIVQIERGLVKFQNSQLVETETGAVLYAGSPVVPSTNAEPTP